MRLKSFLLMLAGGAVCLHAMAQPASDSASISAGRAIYKDGVLADGTALRARRTDIGAVSGAAAACVNCHRPSGLGTVEGDVAIPPISGQALFGDTTATVVRMDRRYNPGLSVPHAPYNLQSLGEALRNGRSISGRTLHPLMPRFDLNDAQVAALAAYLNTLSAEQSPGIDAETIHMATVIAPGVSEARKTTFVKTITAAVNQMNMNVLWGKRQKMLSVEERRLRSRRKWTLDIWQLSGPSSDWPAQLAKYQRQRAVFALVSGLANDEWQPVQDFCETHQVACWFPSLRRPPGGAEQAQFSLYFSAGVDLEAQVIANRLKGHGGALVQWVSANPVAQAGAATLKQLLGEHAATALELPLSTDSKTLINTLSNLGPDDSLVLWLKPEEIQSLKNLPAVKAHVWLSSTLGNDEQVALPSPLRRQATLVQTLEVAKLRSANVERLKDWLAGSQLALTDLQLQSEVNFATTSLQVILRSMLNNLHTQYLIERAESMLAGIEAARLQEEIDAMMMAPMNKQPLATKPSTAEQTALNETSAKHREQHMEQMRMRGGTTVYPRLSLAPGQRFASKGAYLEVLNPDALGIIGTPEWIVP